MCDRDKFEAWHKEKYRGLNYKVMPGGQYLHERVNLDYQIWQAAVEHCKQGEPTFMIIDHDTLWRQVGEAKFNETPDHQRMKLFTHAMPKSDDRTAEELVKVNAANAELLEALGNCLSELQDWAAYASDYFKHKHDLVGCINGYAAIIAKHTVK